MENNTKIWAKSDGTSLIEHTIAVMECAYKLWKKVNGKVKTEPLSEKEFCKLLLLSAFSHDLGKVWPPFQEKLGNKGFPVKEGGLPDVPHNLLSIFFLNKEKALEFIKQEKIAPLLYSAIAFHHWRSQSAPIVSGINPILREISEKLSKNNLGRRLEEILKEEFSGNSYKIDEKSMNFEEFISFDKEFAEYIANGGDFISSRLFYFPYLNALLPQRLIGRTNDQLWIFLSGFLMRADHFASWKKGEESSQRTKGKKLSQRIEIEKTFPKVKFLGGLSDDWWQKRILEGDERKSKNIILVAPTGMGKTEFAFGWGEGHKFIFTLPLRVATNQIFERAEKAFTNGNVGLLHSDADIFLQEHNQNQNQDQNQDQNQSQNQEGEIPTVLELARHLSLPVLIATGDQFFPSALRYPGYERIYATLGYSRLIIDEVQAYEPRAAAIIVKIIKDIAALGGKFLLMTATLPQFVEEELKETNPEKIDLYKKYGNLKFKFPKKHKVEVIKGDIKDCAGEIVKKARDEKKRVLVVLNTVEKAQEVYKEIKGKSGGVELILLHSRFTFEDRKNKEEEAVSKLKKRREEEIKENKSGKGTIVIATQIVEASLDIDADYLYTEIAPADSLVQRMGRVLRGIRPVEVGEEDHRELCGDETKIEANIKVFVNYKEENKKIEYESGKGRVYKNYLIEATLYVLKNSIKKKSIENLLKEIREEYKKEKNKGKKKKVQEEPPREYLLDKLREKVKESLKENKSFFLEEPKKKLWVEEVYNKDFLEKTGYLKNFYDTLSILEAGYVSERKSEAQRLFRDIRSMNIIPANMLDEAKEKLKKFAGKSYTEFKKKFINRFVVPVNESTVRWKYHLYPESFHHYIPEDIEDRRKLLRYTQDIFVADFEYDEDHGLRRSSGS